ncbi:ABC transporter permease [Paenibacillus sp. NEAU-GSW1]|uniref:ABC transporter permease n=1 Tax=Paenibacillus sp. NEAU-GSW1 TaxID=2682486 RepID=UPI0012E26734|nr:ABC transporter permease [Paenibacillus sp. NEAU-GSW1]MUT67808.1 ABC transporter permease [Paenibacillus sp. NEAU-GSW1]
MNAVWRLTWTELLRKRVTLMTIVMTAIFLIAFWFVSRAIVGEQLGPQNELSIADNLFNRFSFGSVILSLGFFFGAFAVAFLAIFSSVSAVMGEAEHGVLQSVLARPLPRWKWYIARWFGFTVFGIGYTAIMFIAIVYIAWLQTGLRLEAFVMFKAYLLFASVVPLFVSLTMLGSCYLSALGNGIGMTMLYGLGWLGSMIERVSDTGLTTEEGLHSLKTITGIITLIMPSDALQQRMLGELLSVRDLAGAIDVGGSSALSLFMMATPPSNTFLVYAAIYTVVILLAGLLVIQKKDF